jgi:hypothetical protein
MNLLPFMVVYLGMAILGTCVLAEFAKHRFSRGASQLPVSNCRGPFCRELSNGAFCSYTCELWENNFPIRLN